MQITIPRFIITVAWVLVLSTTSLTQEMQYKPGGSRFARRWQEFYAAGRHESELATPLIKGGPAMVPAISEAIKHPDMKYRRYAISALGAIRDKRAVPVLTNILQRADEIDYFRGDALEAIYQIDRQLGVKLADQYKDETNYLKNSVQWIREAEAKRARTNKHK